MYLFLNEFLENKSDLLFEKSRFFHDSKDCLTVTYTDLHVCYSFSDYLHPKKIEQIIHVAFRYMYIYTRISHGL